MQTSTVLIIVIGFLVLLVTACLAIIAYLAKRILDEKPIAIKESVAAGTPPVVVTRADLKVAREFETEQNFRKNPAQNLVDLDTLSPEMAMAEMDKYNARGEE